MTEKELLEKQNKITLDFFERLQKDFDLEYLTHEGTKKRKYRGWYFEWDDHERLTIQKQKGNYEWIQLVGKKRLMRKIKRFIDEKYQEKEDKQQIFDQVKKLEPMQEAIEDTFRTPASSIHNSLNT